MQDFDPRNMKDLANLKNVNDADALLQDMKASKDGNEIKNEYKALQEVEDLKRLVEKQTYIIHAFWRMLKAKGATNEEFNQALTEAVLLEKRTDYKNITVCPQCGKGLQSMENKPFTSKCYYCGVELFVNPYERFDNLDPYDISYTEEPAEESATYTSDAEEDAKEMQSAADIISQSFEPYDVTKDLNFDDENI